MTQFSIELLKQIPVAHRRTEHVERKGIGHPDTICDNVMEAASIALSGIYLAEFGHVLHYNLDKGLLVAGRSVPAPGGGRIQGPMRLIFGDRATTQANGKTIPVGEIVATAASNWLMRHLRFVEPTKHVVFQDEIQSGSRELVDIFSRPELVANDTSAGVGYAPLTETEEHVLAAEAYLNSPPFKARFPEIGEDIKVMAYRQGRLLSLTVAAAFVDRFVPDQAVYFARKAEAADDVRRYLTGRLEALDSIDVAINTLDDPQRGLDGMYLTVLGTSAEGADGGEVGRGNRVNGLISLHRPMTTEAAAGKNPVSHVGKIYNVLAHQMAHRICESIPDIDEAVVWLCSQIGRKLTDPWSVAVEFVAQTAADSADYRKAVQEVVAKELNALPKLIDRLVRGELPIC